MVEDFSDWLDFRIVVGVSRAPVPPGVGCFY